MSGTATVSLADTLYRDAVAFLDGLAPTARADVLHAARAGLERAWHGIAEERQRSQEEERERLGELLTALGQRIAQIDERLTAPPAPPAPPAPSVQVPAPTALPPPAPAPRQPSKWEQYVGGTPEIAAPTRAQVLASAPERLMCLRMLGEDGKFHGENCVYELGGEVSSAKLKSPYVGFFNMHELGIVITSEGEQATMGYILKESLTGLPRQLGDSLLEMVGVPLSLDSLRYKSIDENRVQLTKELLTNPATVVIPWPSLRQVEYLGRVWGPWKNADSYELDGIRVTWQDGDDGAERQICVYFRILKKGILKRREITSERYPEILMNRRGTCEFGLLMMRYATIYGDPELLNVFRSWPYNPDTNHDAFQKAAAERVLAENPAFPKDAADEVLDYIAGTTLLLLRHRPVGRLCRGDLELIVDEATLLERFEGCLTAEEMREVWTSELDDPEGHKLLGYTYELAGWL